LKERQKEREEEKEEDVSSYWMTLRKRETTGNGKRKH
jgi:hypothetical protein